ncbi:hypothetical protein [Maricaulis parjimensis]|uniref:hypothetical protein n=1 Tax=Maricaulis parjimensis TaxID=144023 RepID=UPI00193ACF92|nr:hypothetical protein [Maricaulis parjimensis]
MSATTDPEKRHVERWIAFAISIFLSLAASYFVLGLMSAPVEEYVNLQDDIHFADVQPVVGPFLFGVLAVTAISCVIGTLLQAFNTRWSLPVMLFYFLSAKLSWILSSFLPNYDGGATGAVLTLIQLIMLFLVFRTQGHKWFRLQA